MSNTAVVLAAAILAVVVLSAVFAGVLAPHDPLASDLTQRLKPPAWLPGGEASHPLGTDALGRDLLSRILYGGRASLLIALLAVVVRGGVGSLLGIVAGYRGGFIDAVIMRVADIQLALPFFVLALAVIAVLGPDFWTLVVVLGVTGWVDYARVIRSEVLSLRERDFVAASVATGTRTLRILTDHIVPNVRGLVVVLSSLEVGRMIVFEASLSFLGLGVQPPTPEWGAMIADGRDYLASHWWLATIPGVAILLTVLAFNILGDWLQDRFDPTVVR